MSGPAAGRPGGSLTLAAEVTTTGRGLRHDEYIPPSLTVHEMQNLVGHLPPTHNTCPPNILSRTSAPLVKVGVLQLGIMFGVIICVIDPAGIVCGAGSM